MEVLSKYSLPAVLNIGAESSLFASHYSFIERAGIKIDKIDNLKELQALLCS